MKTVLYLFILTIWHSICLGQTRIITGRIIDQESDEPVYNARVQIEGSSRITYSNYLGYFQFELAQGYDQLIITHVSYQTSKAIVPDVDNFMIHLSPSKHDLGTLNLNIYPRDKDIKQESPIIGNSGQEDILERNAAYSPGWEAFFRQLGYLITTDSSFIKHDINCQLDFLITAEGSVEEVVLNPDTSVNRELMRKSISQINDWIPAIQNGYTTDQDFSIRIFYDPDPEVFTITEKPAEPIGGLEAFWRYVGDNINYPRKARALGIEGIVYVQFVVSKDGFLTDAEVIKGIGAECDKEAVRVVSSSPKWNPASNNDKLVNQRLIVSITFSLDRAKNFEDRIDVLYPDLYSKFIVTAKGIGHIPSGHTPSSSETTPAVFPGGLQKLEKFLEKHQKQINETLPPNSSDDKVWVKFLVDENGEIQDINVSESLGPTFDEEAIRLYSIMPPWTPATKDGIEIVETVSATAYFGTVKPSKIEAAHQANIKGTEFFKKGNFERSVSFFSKAIEAHPTNVDYYLNRATANLELGQTENACLDLKHIMPYDQDALEAYNSLCK